MAQKYLKTKDGKCVQVRKYAGKPQLCVVDSQGPGTKVEILTRRDTQVTFRFNYKGENYVPKANENTLELVKDDNLDSDSYWFVRENIGGSEHYGLRTVAQPQRNLITLKAARLLRLALSHNNLPVKITTKECC